MEVCLFRVWLPSNVRAHSTQFEFREPRTDTPHALFFLCALWVSLFGLRITDSRHARTLSLPEERTPLAGDVTYFSVTVGDRLACCRIDWIERGRPKATEASAGASGSHAAPCRPQPDLRTRAAMGCTSSKDEERPGTRQNSFTFGSVSLWSSSSALNRQLGATAAATKGPLAPGMGGNTSLSQPLPSDKSTRTAKCSQRAAEARRSQNEALYTEKSFREYLSMYDDCQNAAPEAAAPEAVRPVMGTLAWFMGPDLETSSPVCLREEEAAKAAQEPR